MEDIEQAVNKGGIVWFQSSIRRYKRGLSIWVQAHEKLEEFVKSYGDGGSDVHDLYGKLWQDIDNKGLRLYRLEPMAPAEFQVQTYTMARPHEQLRTAKEGKTNLSFLRYVGISSPDGVRFGIPGRFGRDYVKGISQEVNSSIRSIIMEYIVPIEINVRISSQDI